MADQNALNEIEEIKQLESELGMDTARAEMNEIMQLESELGISGSSASTGQKAGAFAEGVGTGVTLGYWPEVQAGAAGLVPGSPDMPYDERLEIFRDIQKERKDPAPGYFLAGELAGTVAPGMAVGKAARGIGQAAKGAGALSSAAKASTIGQKSGLIGNTVKLGTEGAAWGYAQNPNTPDGKINRGEMAKYGTMVGALPLAGKALKLGAWASKKALGLAGGVSKDVIEEVIEDSALLNLKHLETKEQRQVFINELADKAETHVAGLRDDLERANIDLNDAKKEYNSYKQFVRKQYALDDMATKQAFKDVDERMNYQFQKQKEWLGKNVEPPMSLQDSVTYSLSSLKKKVTDQAAEATEVLIRDLTPDKIQTFPFRQIDDFMDDRLLEFAAKKGDDYVAVTEKLQPSVDTLLKIKIRFRELNNLADSGQLSARNVRRQLQQLGKDANWDLGAGQFDEHLSMLNKNIRSIVDDWAKSDMISPAYRDAMLPLAADAKLLNQATDLFGKPSRLRTKLKKIDAPFMNEERIALEELSERSGRDFSHDLNDYVNIKDEYATLSKEGFIKGHPERVKYEEALQELDALKARDTVTKNMQMQAEIDASEAAQNLAKQQVEVSASKKALEDLGSLKSGGMGGKLENLALALGRKDGRAIQIMQEFTRLGKLTGDDFIKEMNKARIARYFDSEIRHGSKGVNFWAMVGYMAAGGVAAGPIGLAAGSVFGAVMDRHGPRFTQRILQGVTKLKGIPTVKKIQSLGLPSEETAFLLEQLHRYSMIAGPRMMVGPMEAEDMRREIRTSDTLSSSEKANALNDINKDGSFGNVPKLMGIKEGK